MFVFNARINSISDNREIERAAANGMGGRRNVNVWHYALKLANAN